MLSRTRRGVRLESGVTAFTEESIYTALPDFAALHPGYCPIFYRPVKQQLTLRLDADVVAWFKSHTTSSEGYQTRINRALREYVQGQASRSRRSRA
jgi:uncharacterized protein (DUF4415 family)